MWIDLDAPIGMRFKQSGFSSLLFRLAPRSTPCFCYMTVLDEHLAVEATWVAMTLVDFMAFVDR